jgi:hypothetical protein
MNLIETYLSEVGRHLPGKSRADILAEIRSTLEDMLEERSKKAGRPVDDEMTFEVLKEYGAPEKVAASYLPERYLIGPSLYPIFITVISIVLAVVGVLALIGLGIALGHTLASPQTFFNTLVKALAEFGASAMTGLGNVVLIFAIIEWALFRAGRRIEAKEFPHGKEWDPRVLTKITPPDRVKLGETIADIVFSFAAIVIFNFYPQIIGFTPSLNSLVENGNLASVTFTPLLSEAFFRYVPFLTVVWVLTILLDIILLRLNYWNALTRGIAIGLRLLKIVIAAAMLAGPSLVAITLESLTATIGDAGTASILMTLLSQLVRGILWLVIILEGFEAARIVYRLITRKQTPLYIPENK